MFLYLNLRFCAADILRVLQLSYQLVSISKVSFFYFPSEFAGVYFAVAYMNDCIILGQALSPAPHSFKLSANVVYMSREVWDMVPNDIINLFSITFLLLLPSLVVLTSSHVMICFLWWKYQALQEMSCPSVHAGHYDRHWPGWRPLGMMFL